MLLKVAIVVPSLDIDEASVVAELEVEEICTFTVVITLDRELVVLSEVSGDSDDCNKYGLELNVSTLDVIMFEL